MIQQAQELANELGAGGKKPGKVFMIRGDMDALPIVEETDEEFKSTK